MGYLFASRTVGIRPSHRSTEDAGQGAGAGVDGGGPGQGGGDPVVDKLALSDSILIDGGLQINIAERIHVH